MQHQPVLYCFYLCAYVTGKCNEPTPIFAKQRSFLFQAKHATLLPRFIRVSLPVHLALFTSRMKNPVGMMTRHRYQKTKRIFLSAHYRVHFLLKLSVQFLRRESAQEKRKTKCWDAVLICHGPISNYLNIFLNR
jgi:hypothetical protein